MYGAYSSNEPKPDVPLANPLAKLVPALANDVAKFPNEEAAFEIPEVILPTVFEIPETVFDTLLDIVSKGVIIGLATEVKSEVILEIGFDEENIVEVGSKNCILFIYIY